MEKQYLGITGLTRFLERLYGIFARLKHTHAKADITDFPTIPTKLSELENDCGLLTTEAIDSIVVSLMNGQVSATLMASGGDALLTVDGSEIIAYTKL